MRSNLRVLCSLTLLSALVACSSKDDAPASKVQPAPRPQIKQPVDKTPLPALATDTGGATGKPLWATGFGGLGIDAARGVAVVQNGDHAGDIYVAGYFDGETDFGPAGKHAATPNAKDPKKLGSDAYVVKLTDDGKIAWGKTFGAGRDDAANGVAVSAKGDRIAVVGQFLDELEIGEYKRPANGSEDMFVAVFDRDGNIQWLWGAGGVDSDGANCVVATADGGWLVGGSFAKTMVIQDVTLTSRGHTDAVLIKLSSGGDVEWTKQFGGRYDDTISHLALDARGNINVQGVFRDTSDWGGKPLVAHGGSDNDVVLAKYDVNGDHIWSQGYGNAFNDVAGGLTVDPAGNITMVGSFDKSVSFGDGDDHTSNGESDAFITRFTTDGKLMWARTFGAEREDIAFGVAADAAGNTITTGWFQGTVDFGGGRTLTSKTINKDVFALKLDPKGQTIWAQSWGDHDHDQGRAIATDAKGAAIVVGIFRFSLSIGSGPSAPPTLESVRTATDPIPKPDTFVIKLDR